MSVKDRFCAHMKPSTQKIKSNYKIYNAIKKYGSDKFYVETLEENIPLELLDEKEIEYIALYDSYKNGYNSTKGGDGRIINKIDHEEELLQMARNGTGAQELAELFGVNKATIFRTLHKLGFYYRANPNEVLRLAQEGKTYKEISELIKCNPTTVQRILHRKGIRRRRIRLKDREDFDYDAMFLDYANGTSVKEISIKYDISETSFHRVRKSKGIPVRT